MLNRQEILNPHPDIKHNLLLFSFHYWKKWLIMDLFCFVTYPTFLYLPQAYHAEPQMKTERQAASVIFVAKESVSCMVQ